MLKKLRIKFILINMTLVTVMLGIVFGLLYYSTSRNLETESIRMIERLAAAPDRPGPPDKGPRDTAFRKNADVHLPYFTVLLDRDGQVIETNGNYFDLSDEEQLNQILSAAFDTGSDSGTLPDYRLRFHQVDTPTGPRMVFVDMTSEQSTLHHLIRTLAAVGGAAFLIFLAISFFLASWAVRPVELAWKQQKQFVADASHELKTPLTVIMTDAELLHAPDCPEADRSTLSQSILAMSRQMRGLVESLLDLARMDNGSVKEEFCPLVFSDLAAEAAMTFEPLFFEQGLTLTTQIEPDIQMRGIPGHLKQLISILLDNACKYASPGGETRICLTRKGHNRCLLEVSDQGQPIPEEDLAKIFRRFYRADKARAMNHSYGLGLSIAEGIAAEHKGRIWCESRDGWNTFFVELSE